MSGSWRRALGRQRLLVSGFGKWGGGVYDVTSGEPVALDDLPTSGLAVGGGRLWRVLRAPGEQTASCELVSYDDRGVRSYQRLDTVRDPHDVCWHDGAVHVSASWDGTVWQVAADGTTAPVWQGGTVPDSWHLNSLLVVDGRLHVCAFGRFDGYKAWKIGEGGLDADGPAGFVHDVDRDEDVLRGLAHPHTPRRVGDRWYVCESTWGALTELSVEGRVRRRARIGRYARGLAIVGDHALVGGNAHRDAEHDRAEVVVVDLRTFEVVERVAMPCLEIYDILPVSPDLARGLALGFAGNPARTVEQHRGTAPDAPLRPTPTDARVQLATCRTTARLAAAGRELEPAVAAHCKVRGRLPATVIAGATRTVRVTVANESDTTLATVAPCPIRLAARWFPLGRRRKQDDPGLENPEGDGATTRNPMAALPRVVGPHEEAEVEILLVAPDTPGRYEVRVALHQTNVGWFGTRLQQRVKVDRDPGRRPDETPAAPGTTTAFSSSPRPDG